jgi:hypothetical protein
VGEDASGEHKTEFRMRIEIRLDGTSATRLRTAIR